MQIARQLIGQPVARLGEDLGLMRADFFVQLAHCRVARRLALVDAALRHLPGARRIDTPADEDAVVGRQQHDADAAPIGLGRYVAHANSVIAPAGAAVLAIGDGAGRGEDDALAVERGEPGRDAVEQRRRERGDAERGAVALRDCLQSRERLIDRCRVALAVDDAVAGRPRRASSASRSVRRRFAPALCCRRTSSPGAFRASSTGSRLGFSPSKRAPMMATKPI